MKNQSEHDTNHYNPKNSIMRKISFIILTALYLYNCSSSEIDKPMVKTLDATNTTDSTATLNGKVEYPGDPAYTEKGFVYSAKHPSPTINDSEDATIKVTVAGTSTDFSADIMHLTKSEIYHVRAYITNERGTVYGDRIDFTADPVPCTLKAVGLMVQRNDLSIGNTWDMAYNLCKSSRVGGYEDWRLPTIEELREIYNNRNVIGKLSGKYWSSDQNYHNHYHDDPYQYCPSNSHYYYYNMDNGSYDCVNKDSIFKIRAVRSIGN